MPASIPRGSIGKGAVPLGSGGNGQSFIPKPLGQLVRIDDYLGVKYDPHSLYQHANKMMSDDPHGMVQFFENYQRLVSQNWNQREQIQPLGAPFWQLPMMETYIQKVAKAFFNGLFDGASQTIGKNPQLVSRLNLNLGMSTIITAVFPSLFQAGALVGLWDDAKDTVMGIIDLVVNFEKMVDSVWEMLKAILENEKAAYELGKAIGKELGNKLVKFSNFNPFRFTFELGRLIGPLIIYAVISAVLALSGIGAGVSGGVFGARFLKDLLQTLRKLPRAHRRYKALVKVTKKSTKGFAARKLVSIAAGARKSGMLDDHARVFSQVARSENRIIINRFTNTASRPGIKNKWPAKPLEVSIHTDPKTGIVTVSKSTPQGWIDKALNAGHYIVDKNLVPRNKAGGAMRWKGGKPPCKLEPGQVFDKASGNPFVGDYDLMSIIDPNSLAQNVVGIGKDLTNPDMKRVTNLLNTQMGDRRIMHGPHDGFDTIVGAGDGAIAFHPNGDIQIFDTVKELEDYFDKIGRNTIKQKYETSSIPDATGNVLDFPANRF